MLTMRRKESGPLLVLDAREVLAAQELHDEIELAVLGLAEVDDGDGVRDGSAGSPRAPR
jgi:hypothetical protein